MPDEDGGLGALDFVNPHLSGSGLSHHHGVVRASVAEPLPTDLRGLEVRMEFTAGSGGSRDLLATLAPRFTPGTRYSYCTADSVVGLDAAPRDGGAAMAGLSPTPPTPFLRPGRLPSTITMHAGFGLHWWPLDDTGRRVSADGSRGQFGYVDRDARVVVVKTSDWPYDEATDRQCRDLSYLALPAIARAAASLVSVTQNGVPPG